MPNLMKNYLTTFKATVRKLLAYFLWIWCICTHKIIILHKDWVHDIWLALAPLQCGPKS